MIKNADFKQKSISIKTKISITIFSFIFFIILLELILRIMGHVYVSMRVAPNEKLFELKKEKGMYVILCVGDSFTFGGDLPINQSYPFHLQKILSLNNLGKKFKVINAGLCDRNSTQVLQALPKNIKYYKPHMVILLVGQSNWFNFIGFNKKTNFYTELKDVLYDLRVYKMVKIITLNLEQRMLLIKFDKHNPLLEESFSINSITDPDMHILNQIAEARFDLIDYLYSIGENEKASGLFKKYFNIDRNSDLLVYQMTEFLEHVYDVIGEDRKYDANLNLLVEDLQKKLENNPNLRNKLIMDYFLFFKNIQTSYQNKEIEKRLREDLMQIVNICKKNNIKVIIQDYPLPYPMADMALRDTATKHSLPLVRNSRVFSELLKKEGKWTYFLGDNHCTALGYRVMAENIYKEIVSQNIVAE